MLAQKNSEVRQAGAELIGQMAGEYRMLRKLGAGGFGTVYEAEHPLLKRKAAVKVLHALPGVDSVAVKRFIEEARSASQIRHRHIVDIFSFGTLPNGQYFYVMDWLEGMPLDRYLKQQGRLTPDLALPVLRPIAQAIDALHAAAIVHRDLKPANIYLAWDSSGELVPKLLDFGLVKLLGHASIDTASGVPIGTPHYMSPEQCRGEAVDARADVYSFGVICYELITGKVPFHADSAAAILVAHVIEPPPRMSSVVPGLAPELDEPVLHMLAKDPQHRPASAGAALQELERAAMSSGVSLGDGPAWLPRPVIEPPPAPESEPAATGRSGTRGTHAGEGAVTQRAGSWWGGGIALALLLGGASFFILRGADETSEPVAPPPAATANPVPPAAAAAAVTASDPAPQSAPAAPPAPAPLAPAASPPMLKVALTLHGAPPGASVMLGDQKLGETPGPVLLPQGQRPLRITIVGPNFGPRHLQVTPSGPLEVVLTPEKSRASQRRSTPRDLENPF